jgi:hypothetical protein
MCVFLIKAFYIALRRLHSFGFGKIFPVQCKPLKSVSISHLDAAFPLRRGACANHCRCVYFPERTCVWGWGMGELGAMWGAGGLGGWGPCGVLGAFLLCCEQSFFFQGLKVGRSLPFSWLGEGLLPLPPLLLLQLLYSSHPGFQKVLL